MNVRLFATGPHLVRLTRMPCSICGRGGVPINVATPMSSDLPFWQRQSKRSRTKPCGEEESTARLARGLSARSLMGGRTRAIVAATRTDWPLCGGCWGQGPREDRNLIYLMVACLIFFVARRPSGPRSRMSRHRAGHVAGGDLMAMAVHPAVEFSILLAAGTQIILKVNARARAV